MNNTILVERHNNIAFITLNRPEKRCLLYTSQSPRDGLLSRIPSSS